MSPMAAEQGNRRRTQYYMVVFREDQTGAQYKTFTSLGTLLRFTEEIEFSKKGPDPFDHGPYDVYLVDIEEMVVVPYDIKSVYSAAKKAGRQSR